MQVPGQSTFPLAPENVVMQARYEASGWHIQIAVRRQGAPWADDAWTHYHGLTTTELIQVVDDHLSSHL